MTMSMTALPLLALVIAAPGASPEAAPNRPALSSAADQTLAEKKQQCRERIAMLRHARGLPPLAEPDKDRAAREPLLIAAVDRQIEDCPVLLMYRDQDDIRAVPQPSDQRASLLPAR